MYAFGKPEDDVRHKFQNKLENNFFCIISTAYIYSLPTQNPVLLEICRPFVEPIVIVGKKFQPKINNLCILISFVQLIDWVIQI